MAARLTGALFAASEQVLADGSWVDISDAIRMAAEQIESGPQTDDRELAGLGLFGFTELNALEERLVRALATWPTPQAAFIPWLDQAPAFEATTPLVRTMERLWGVAARTADVEAPLPAAAPPALPLLRDLFRTDRDAVHDIPQITLASAPDPVQEWLDVARWIWEKMEQSDASGADLRFSDIHVVAPNGGQVRSIARDVFAEAGIPAHWAGGVPLVESDTGRSLMQFLETIDSGLTCSAVMELLTTCPLKAEWLSARGEEVPPTEWDRIARLAGVVGGLGAGRTVEGEWIVPLERHAARLEQRLQNEVADAEMDEIGESRARLQRDLAYTVALTDVVEHLNGIRAKIAEAERTRRWAEWVAAVREGWREVMGFPESEGDALARVERLLDEIALYDRVAPLAPSATCRRLLADALGRQTVRPADDNEAGVRVSDLAGVLYRRPRAVVVTGLVDSEFPVPCQRTALAMRPPETIACRTSAERTTQVDKQVAIGYQHYATALGAAREQVRLSYARAQTGQEERRLPSSVFFDTLRRLVRPLPDEHGSPRPWEQRTLQAALAERGTWQVRRPVPECRPPYLNVSEFDLAWAGRMRGSDRGRQWVGALREQGLAGRGLELLAAREAGGVSRYDGWIDDPALAERVRAEMEKTFPISPSRLETYAVCPFRYFARHVLGVSPMPEPSDELMLDALTCGSILHSVLSGFFRSLRSEGVVLHELSAEQCRQRFDDFVTRYRARLSARIDLPAPLVWDAQCALISERAWRAVDCAYREAATWQPHAMELGLGVVTESTDPTSQECPITVDVVGHGPVELRGIIDRVDFGHDGSSARIIDYKWGKAPGKAVSCLDAGRRVQLVIYATGLADWLAASGERRAVTEVAYHYLRQSVPASTEPSDEAWPLHRVPLDEAREELGVVLRVVLSGIRGGVFPPVPENAPNDPYGDCAYCDVAAACGSLTNLTGRWRSLIEDDLIAELQGLRTPDR